MEKVVIYTKKICPYCDRAKNLLKKLQIPYKEIDLNEYPDQLPIMIEKSKRRTVPQIFIHGESIGGFDDLKALQNSGKLMALLKN